MVTKTLLFGHLTLHYARLLQKKIVTLEPRFIQTTA